MGHEASGFPKSHCPIFQSSSLGQVGSQGLSPTVALDPEVCHTSTLRHPAAPYCPLQGLPPAHLSGRPTGLSALPSAPSTHVPISLLLLGLVPLCSDESLLSAHLLPEALRDLSSIGVDTLASIPHHGPSPSAL